MTTALLTGAAGKVVARVEPDVVVHGVTYELPVSP